jgi:hypothetical protein
MSSSQNVTNEAYSYSCWSVTDKDNLEILEGMATCRLHRTRPNPILGGGVRSLTNRQRQMMSDPYHSLELKNTSKILLYKDDMLPVTYVWFVVYLCQYFSSQKPLRQLLPGTSFSISTFNYIIKRRQFACNSNTKTREITRRSNGN